jgi:Fic family protein
MDIISNPYLMEPLLPAEGKRELVDLALELVKCSSSLAANLPEEIVLSIGDLVRSMNCYYSNLIEGHNTHPIDIERALKNDYSKDPEKRNLQLEAFAHIEVQKKIDSKVLPFPVCSKQFLCWIHQEFCSRLPSEMLKVKSVDSNKIITLIPGKLRSGEVKVGDHLAPVHTELDKFLELFEARYESSSLSKLQKIISIAASHHRLLWIHPFYDGNGRVARLFSHAYLKNCGLGSSLWSVSRGFARNSQQYKKLLAGADNWRQGDLDGRGSLSEEGLVNFCSFFLKSCIDQVLFMNQLLEPRTLLNRVEKFCSEEQEKGVLLKGSYLILREIILVGALERGKVENVTGYKERQSRNIVKTLIDNSLITSVSIRSPLKLHIPHAVIERWFPKLYPASAS